MKTLASAATTVFVALICGAVPSVGQNPTISPLCSKHPATTRDEVVKARKAGRGIWEQYIQDRRSRPPGREVTPGANPEGGDCPPDSTPLGSAVAAIGELLYNGQLHCSAVLVTNTMIVTAAHCIKGFDQYKLEFVLGLDSRRPVQRSAIYSAGVHLRYDEGHFGVNDIAYAYLSNRMTEAAPLGAPEDILSRTGNLSLLHVGYGIAGAQPGARRCVNIPVLDRCDDSFSYATANLNTCNGDSGGAALIGDSDKILLAGITDWGDGACAEFGVDVDVGYYTDWIQNRKSKAPQLAIRARRALGEKTPYGRSR